MYAGRHITLPLGLIIDPSIYVLISASQTSFIVKESVADCLHCEGVIWPTGLRLNSLGGRKACGARHAAFSVAISEPPSQLQELLSAWTD